MDEDMRKKKWVRPVPVDWSLPLEELQRLVTDRLRVEDRRELIRRIHLKGRGASHHPSINPFSP